MKVLIIGLDGGTWNVLDDYLLENHMPNLKKLKNGGFSGILRSTEPPASPLAWTSFLTGCNPGKHGVTGFHFYSMEDHTLGIQNSTHCLVPNMYQHLSNQGYKIISINVPWTYPCYKVNGVLVAGMGFAGAESNFTYPPDFKDELLAKVPTYDFRARVQRSKTGQQDLKQDIDDIRKSFQQRIDAAKLASKTVDWDVMVVQFHDTDGMNHCIWKYISPDSRDEYPEYRDEAFKAFESLDKSIGELLNMAGPEETVTFVISDHGGGLLSALVKANLFLKKWGYLKTKSRWEKWLEKTAKSLKKRFGIQVKTIPVHSFAQTPPNKLGINLKKTKAFISHTAIPSGHLYLNIKGRQPTGTVEPGVEYDRIIAKLKERFLSVKDPLTGERLFTRVVTPAELYGENIMAS